MIELHIPNTTVQTGVAPVSWCVSRDTLDELARRGIPDPQVLIVVAPENNYEHRKEGRKVVPLKELMTYVEFRSPGPNRVFAIVFGRSEARMKESFLHKEDGRWCTSILTHDGTAVHEGVSGSGGHVSSSAPLRVEVPSECFATTPFDAGWVNLLFTGRPENQCDFRRRRIFAYTVQPILALVVYLFRLLGVLVYLLMGIRGIDFRPLTQPLTFDTGDIWKRADGSFVVPRVESPLRFACLAFSPIIVLGALGIGLLNYGGVSTALLFTAGTVVAVIGVIIVILLAMSGHAALLERWNDKNNVQQMLAEGEVPWYLREADEISCAPGRGPRTGAGDVPRHLRTMRLRFEDLKAKVCRPFAR